MNNECPTKYVLDIRVACHMFFTLNWKNFQSFVQRVQKSLRKVQHIQKKSRYQNLECCLHEEEGEGERKGRGCLCRIKVKSNEVNRFEG